MARSFASSIPPDRLERYDRLVTTVPGLERKGATMPYTSLNGHMFSFLAADGMLALRLPEPDRTTFLAAFGATLHEAHGVILKEYVRVPEALLSDLDALQPWFAAAHAYAASLKSKATRRR